ncbi:unnamed protein product, partial [Meganyctiphanes norvegica]
ETPMKMPWNRMKSLNLLLLMMIITTMATTAGGSELSRTEQETALLKEVLTDYNSDALPSHSTTLEFGQFSLLHFDMNEVEHYIELDGWYNWQWKDPRLAWNATKYGKVSALRIPAHKLWRPDIVLYSSVDWLNLETHGNVHAIVYSGGSVLYIPPAHIKSACVADLTYWPHDIQYCILKLGSWVSDGTLLNISVNNDQMEIEDIQKSKTSNLTRSNWELVSHNVSRNVQKYLCCPEEYLDITFEMTIKRNAPALSYTFKLPAVGLGILSLFVFLLPPAAGEKLLLSCLLLLMDLQFLIHTADVVQYSPTHIPIVVRMVCEQLVLVLVSVIVSVIAMRMARPPHGEQLPSFIMSPLRALAPLLLLGKYSNMSENYHAVPGKYEVELGDSMTTPLESNTKKEHGDWILVAATIDRVLFLLYSVIIIFSFIAFTSVL